MSASYPSPRLLASADRLSGFECRSEEHRAFHLRLIPDVEPSPTDPLHLALLMKDILRTLGSVPYARPRSTNGFRR
ncbi:MAG: hypothetical protein ER33_16160 [Cyanobium sp. CACIAM 14]|nr:MAG: hypothetical protein ER33_16160 [Cyanobium sp. CACIAM 14]